MDLLRRHKCKAGVCFGFFVLSFLCSFASTYPDSLFQHKFVNYSVEDGLPSSVVYDVLQDSLGFMWFATESGVSRFDGYEFENFTIEDGLPDNDIIAFGHADDGRIWFLSLSGIGYCEPELKPQFHILEELEGYSVRWVQCFDGQYIFQVSKDNHQQLIFFDPRTQQKKIYEVPYLGKLFPIGGSLWRETKMGLVKMGAEGEVDSIPKSVRYEITYAVEVRPGLFLFSGIDGFYLFDGKSITPLTGKYVPKSKGKDLQSLFIDRSNTIWVSSRDKGLYSLPLACDRPPKAFPEFLGTRFADIYEDREGNFWLPSLTDGIYFLSKYHTYQKNYVPPGKSMQKRIQTVSNIENKQIALGTANAEILFLDPQGIGKVKWGDEYSHERIRGVVSIGPDSVLAYGEKGLSFISVRDQKEYLHGNKLGFKDVHLGKQKDLWFGTSAIIGNMPLHKMKNKLVLEDFHWPEHQVFKQRAVTLLEDNNVPFLWVGNPAGLRIWKSEGGKLFGEPTQLFTASTLDIMQSPIGDIWVSTDGKGVFVIKEGYARTGFTYKCFSTANGTLHSNTCKKVIFGEGNEVWVATNKGISVIKDFSWDKPAREHETDHLNAAHGLLSDNLNDFAILGDSLYAGTDKGLTVFDLGVVKEREKQHPEVLISEVRILEKDTTVQDFYELDYHHRNIKIGFVSFAYASQGNIQYQYKMEPLEQHWITTTQTFAHYPSLDPGKYTFQVKAIDNDGMESLNTTEITLEVSPIWWDTLGFRLCATLLILALFAGFFFFRIRMIRKEEQLKTAHHLEIADYQRQTLSSQMNPHFIFNALVAVQSFILKSDGRSANKYVAKFSKLIRNVLEGSQHKTIALSEEIKTLRLYLELEHLRFGDRFEYDIQVDPELFPGSIQIPPMILQPFVENAIRHGLKPLRGEGRLSLVFELEEEWLKCTVEDNGIGRKKAVEFKSPHHTEYQSRGMELTMKRIELLNFQQGRQAKIAVEDLLDEQGNGKGTRVTVYFPLH